MEGERVLGKLDAERCFIIGEDGSIAARVDDDGTVRLAGVHDLLDATESDGSQVEPLPDYIVSFRKDYQSDENGYMRRCLRKMAERACKDGEMCVVRCAELIMNDEWEPVGPTGPPKLEGSAAELALKEIERVEAKMGEQSKFNSSHEGWAVIREEVDELWEAVKGNDPAGMKSEAIQVAAMALRFLYDISGVPLKGE